MKALLTSYWCHAISESIVYPRCYLLAQMITFNLSKWYLDYVTDLGDVEIAYTGTAHWGPVCLHYSSILEAVEGRVRERHSLRQQARPEQEESTICWRSKALNCETTWQAAAPPVRETVYCSSKGSIEWNCVTPLARAKARERSGLGYVEHLEMTIPPWELPIRALRWGRFTSASDYVIWIDWLGEFSRRIVYLNGEMIPCSTLEDERLEAQDGTRLLMDRSLVLRDGPLGTTALSAVPGIRRMFPARLLQTNECKWRSRARLERRGKAPVEGWAIHEIVSWAQ